MFHSLFQKNKTNKNKIFSPCTGKVHSLSESKDTVFSSGMLGAGCFISPESNYVYSPVSGTVLSVFPTKHAIGIKTESGIEIIVHMGIDTVELGGKYFEVVVSQGDRICKGDLLVTADFKAIKEAGYDTDVIIIVTNRKADDIHIHFEASKHGDLLVDVNI